MPHMCIIYMNIITKLKKNAFKSFKKLYGPVHKYTKKIINNGRKKKNTLLMVLFFRQTSKDIYEIVPNIYWATHNGVNVLKDKGWANQCYPSYLLLLCTHILLWWWWAIIIYLVIEWKHKCLLTALHHGCNRYCL